VNEVYERYVFRCRTQRDEEKFVDFLTDLRLKIKNCNYSEIERPGILWDQIVFGVSNDKIRFDLLKISKLSLDEAIKICTTYEASTIHLSAFQNSQTTTSEVRPDQISQLSRRKPSIIHNCRFCGGSHAKRRCPAYGKTCSSCKKKNHFANA